jgi:MFS family permease
LCSAHEHFQAQNLRSVFPILKLNLNDTVSNRHDQDTVATMFHRLGGTFSFGRKQTAAFALTFNTISWYFIGRLMISKIGSGLPASGFGTFSLQLTYPSAIIISGIIGSMLPIRARRIRFFYIWLFFGVLTSLCTAIPTTFSLSAALAVAGALGASTGVGTAICFSYLAESISIENRGKAAGAILFATLISSAFALLVMPSLDMVFGATLLAVWRMWSFPFLLLMSKEKPLEPNDTNILTSPTVARNRTFCMYFIAWLMFAFIDGLEGVILTPAVAKLSLSIRLIELLVTGFSAIIAGAFSDWIGRKRVLIFGFVSLGIAYAALGLFSQVLASLLFYLVIEGMALGSLWVLFVVVLWGDLAKTKSERFYAVGETPFFLTEIFSVILTPYVSSIPESNSFSLAALFLFMSVLPLLYAPETLPEKSIRDRELKHYLERAKKVREKYA